MMLGILTLSKMALSIEGTEHNGMQKNDTRQNGTRCYDTQLDGIQHNAAAKNVLLSSS